MKLIIYIGQHKTGSSSIQKFFSYNYNSLIKAGILYPSVESEGFSYNVLSLLSPYKLPEELPINAREAHNALAFKMKAEAKNTVPPYFHRNLPHSNQMFVAIRNQMEILKPRVVFLCAEVFSSFAAVSEDLVRRLKEELPVDKVSVICYLRRPDKQLISIQGQWLKMGFTVSPLREDGVKIYYDRFHFDHQKLLYPWINIFGKKNLRIFNYDEIVKTYGDSIKGLMAVSKVDFPDTLKFIENINPSLPYCVMELVNRANMELDRQDARKLRDLILKNKSEFEIIPDSNIEMLGKANREEMSTRYAPIHKFLNKISGKKEFFPNIEDILNTKPVPELEAYKEALPKIQQKIRAINKNRRINIFIKTFTKDNISTSAHLTATAIK